MKAKVPEKAETYEGLVSYLQIFYQSQFVIHYNLLQLEKEKSIAAAIADLEKRILEAQEKNNYGNASNMEEDSLDSFMKGLKDTKPDKQTLSKLKLELTKTKEEHAKVTRLANIAKPASLPELVPQNPVPSTSKDVKSKMFPIIGKRKKVKLQLPTKPATDQLVAIMEVDGEEEEEGEEAEEEGVAENEHKEEKSVSNTEGQTSEEQSNGSTAVDVEESNTGSSSNSSDEDLADAGEFNTIKSLHNTMTFKKFEKILKKGLPPLAGILLMF